MEEEINHHPHHAAVRSIICIDLDCFFVQVEQHRNIQLYQSSYIAVQQHDDIIAVSYPARQLFAVKKHDTPQEALHKCPDIILVHVPMFPGTSKVTYQHYRSHSTTIFQCIQQYLQELFPSFYSSIVFEKASIDEAFIDITRICEQEESIDLILKEIDELNNIEECLSPSGNTLDCILKQQQLQSDDYTRHDLSLCIASIIALKIRKHVKQMLNYEASCGIAHNKFLAKLSSTIHKPNKQTIVLSSHVNSLLSNTLVNKIPKLGIILGSQELKDQFLSKYSNYSIGELQSIPLNEFDECIGEKAASAIFNIARGIDREPVVKKGPPRQVSASMSLTPISNENMDSIKRVIGYLTLELIERLKEDKDEFNRLPIILNCKYRLVDCKEMNASTNISNNNMRENRELLQTTLFEMFEKSVKKNYGHVNQWGLRWICAACTSFVTVVDDRETITNFFSKKPDTITEATTTTTEDTSTTNRLFEPDKNTITCPVCSRSIPISLADIHVNNHYENNNNNNNNRKQSTDKKRKRPANQQQQNNLFNYFKKKRTE
jgi:DNA polymerase eta